MVIMENYYSQEKCRELWLKIDEQHLSYLEIEESTEKIMHRAKLEECIADFLCLAHHKNKFVFVETEDVLYRSCAFKKDFSGYKAATGWNALQIYASNLLTQPWRKEYRQIKTYSGFYKHQIEANLVGAETMFEAMGYKHVGNGILLLEGPICPDRVSNVSRDCLVAYVECQMMKHIWEEISTLFPISWLAILEYRVTHPGNLDQCIRNIKYKYSCPKPAQEPSRSSRELESYKARHQLNTPSSQMSITNSHISAPNNYGALASHNHVALPPVYIPPAPYCVPHTNGCPNNFAAYGYGTYPVHVPVVKQPLPTPTANGCYYPNVIIPSGCPVPTGQLIELDSRNGFDVPDDVAPSRSRRSSRLDTVSSLENTKASVRDDTASKNDLAADPVVKNDDGNWDYVYRDLEKQGYSKDLGERGDILGLTVSDKQRKYIKEPKRVKATNLDEVMNSLSVNDRPLKMTEALEQMEKKAEEKSVSQKERRHSQGSAYENVAPTETQKQTKLPVARVAQSTPVQVKVAAPTPKEPTDLNTPKASVSIAETKNVRTKEHDEQPSRWECKSCTYINETSKDICEMCSKSRHVEDDQPMEVGGPECSQCTLVNPRNAKICHACSNSLKNSPTYI